MDSDIRKTGAPDTIRTCDLCLRRATVNLSQSTEFYINGTNLELRVRNRTSPATFERVVQSADYHSSFRQLRCPPIRKQCCRNSGFSDVADPLFVPSIDCRLNGENKVHLPTDKVVAKLISWFG